MVPKVFVDTNIVFEHALKRANHRDAIELFKLSENEKIECFCSASSFYTLCYVLRKQYSDKQTRLILRQYLSFISVLSADEKQLFSGLASSFKDIEDAFQYHTALGKVDYFVTFNKKDFARYSLAQLEVYTPGEFLKQFS
jgi:predicted nucleic acid-binding protein